MASVRLAGAGFAMADFSCPLCFLFPCVIRILPISLSHCALPVFLLMFQQCRLRLCFSLAVSVCFLS